MNKKVLSYLEKHASQQKGKRFLITGSTSGIGYECAKDLLYLGGEVTFMVRNEEKAKECIHTIENELGHPISAHIVIYDQADPNSIRECIRSLPDTPYDAIVLNAGIYNPKKNSLGKEGNSITLQVNAIGTQTCFEEFYKRFPSSKYVIIDSIVNSSPKKGDYSPYFHRHKEGKPYKDKRNNDYAISKRICMNIFANALESGTKVYMAHPGIAKTNIINAFAPVIKRLGNGFLYLFAHHAWKAALGMCLLCCNDYEKGTYLVPRGPFEIAGYPKPRSMPKRAYKYASNWSSFWENESK
ncbi:MAG: SDR family NAD(P)-dependent oxidoreductase [Bacilli bacterium]|nr:SDR family NAD(P)-dependent oxidoreductase [Bacilli bacterium]